MGLTGLTSDDTLWNRKLKPSFGLFSVPKVGPQLSPLRARQAYARHIDGCPSPW